MTMTAPAPTVAAEWSRWTTPFVFFTGKGGVGKTTIAAASAIALADRGGRVLIVSTDPASNLGDVFGLEVGAEPTPVPGVDRLEVMDIDPEAAALAFRERVIGPYRGMLPATAIATMEEQLAGVCTVEIAAFDEFTALLSDPEIRERYDHVIFDTAPTGHTLRLLSLPAAWSGYIEESPQGASCLGPLAGLEAQQSRYQAALDALADAELTTVALVSRPEASALAEAARAGAELNDIGIANQQLLLNGVLLEDPGGDATAIAIRTRQQDAWAGRPDALAPLPVTEVPLVPSTLTGVDALRALVTPQPVDAVPQPSSAASILGVTDTLRALVDDVEAGGHGVLMTMGKGGVGKTTVASAVAVALADRGHRVILSTTDPAAHVSRTVGEAPDGLELQRIDPVAETARYSAEVMAAAGELDEDGRALLEEDLRSPCTEEIAVFRAFARTMAQADDAFVVLDTAPTGHTLLLLDASSAYHQQLASTGGEVADEVRMLLPRLRDPEQVRIAIVTLPESTPILEASRLADDLVRAGITPYGWIVNASLGATGTRHPLLADRARQEAHRIGEVAAAAQRSYVSSWRAEAPEGAARLREFVA
ncbi:MAG: arsenical pump-driving ATPase [Nitriliruptoraceae bacterium]